MKQQAILDRRWDAQVIEVWMCREGHYFFLLSDPFLDVLLYVKFKEKLLKGFTKIGFPGESQLLIDLRCQSITGGITKIHEWLWIEIGSQKRVSMQNKGHIFKERVDWRWKIRRYYRGCKNPQHGWFRTGIRIESIQIW